MFAQWLDENEEAIINTLITWYRSKNDTRPDEVIRPGAKLALQLLEQSLRGEANWEQASRVGAEQGLDRGIPLHVMTESSYGVYTAISRVLQDKRPEQWQEWLHILGDYMLIASQVVTQVLEAKLEEQVSKRTQEAVIFKTMIENSTDAIVMIDLATDCFTYANQATHEMFGYDYNQQEMVGQVGNQFWPEEDISLWTETIIPQAKAGGWWGEIRLKRRNEDMFDASVVVFPLHNDAGKLINIAATIRDVSEQKQAEIEQAQLQQQIIEAQQRAIQELSTPVIPIMDRIIVMPLIGSIDSLRARDITRNLLAGISQHRAKVVILDVTGVGVMDTGVVNHLNKTIQAARLKGAHTIVTGVSDAVAEAIVELGIDWSDVQALSDLQTGLLVALDSLGVRLAK
jgi:PAS domain S-box-containing protein